VQGVASTSSPPSPPPHRGDLTLEVARRGALNRDELSRLERGDTTQVRFATLAKLLAIYDCSLDDLITIEKSLRLRLADGTVMELPQKPGSPAPGPVGRTTRSVRRR
jgi:DNA-binding Xre family transcriptional regulator